MKKIILFAFIVFCYNANAQNKTVKKENKYESNYNTELLKQNFEIEKTRLKLNSVENNFQSKLDNLELEINAKVDKLDSKINYYLLIGSVALGLILFLINFFGRKLIVEKIENLVAENASNYAEKRTNQVIQDYIDQGKIDILIKEKGEPAIREIIRKIEMDGINVIDAFKVRGEKVISSMLAKQEDSNTKLSEIETDEQIINANKESRVREFFELAMSRKDPLVQIELYKNVLEIEPEHLEALNNIAVSYNNAYNYNKAIEHLDKCIELSSEFALAYANRANSYNLLNELDKAIKDVNKAIKLNPKLDWNYSVKGNILTKLGKLEEAETTFGLAIEINPNSPEAYFSRGFFYEEIKEYEKSELDYIKSEKLGLVNKASLFNNFAVLYRRQKRFDKAIEYLDKARKENPNSPNIDGTLALIYADKGEEENFYKYLLVALEKGCPIWKYLNDTGFNKYREQEKLKLLIESYKKKYVA
jgi:tetratricopeptide (TPR) repeat protein